MISFKESLTISLHIFIKVHCIFIRSPNCLCKCAKKKYVCHLPYTYYRDAQDWNHGSPQCIHPVYIPYTEHFAGRHYVNRSCSQGHFREHKPWPLTQLLPRWDDLLCLLVLNHVIKQLDEISKYNIKSYRCYHLKTGIYFYHGIYQVLNINKFVGRHTT